MIEFTALLAAAVVAMTAARWLRLPGVPLLLIAGVGLSVLVGEPGTGLTEGALLDEVVIENALIFGLTFLVFLAGTELNPRRIGRQRNAAIRIGLAQFFVLAAIGLGVALVMDFDWTAALYLGLALTASSTLVVVNLLRQRQQAFEPFGRLVLGVLLLQDLLVILLLSFMTRMDEGPTGIAMGLGGAVGLGALAWVGLRWVSPWLLMKLKLDEEEQLLAVLAILFFFVGLSQVMGLPLVAGAFLAGVSLSTFPISGLIRGQMSSLSDFFLAVFFVALGAWLAIPSLSELVVAVLLAAVVVLLTPPLVTILAERAGLSARASIESGLLLAQCSEFSLVVALLGVQHGFLDESLLTIVALLTVITMILTPFIATDRMTWALMRWHPSTDRRREQLARQEERPADHVLLLGCGTNGLRLLEELVQRGDPVVVLDDDPAVIQHVRSTYGVETVRGDGADYLALRSAGARNAKVIVSTMRRLSDHMRMLRFARGVPAVVRVFTPEEGRLVERLGGTPVIYAEAAAEDFLQWYERARQTLERDRAEDGKPAGERGV